MRSTRSCAIWSESMRRSDPQPAMPMFVPGRDHAVVAGGSIGGLLAARVLSDYFARVTIIDRDDLSRPGDRPGVAQGQHVHALQARGQLVLEELFPGITSELMAAGAIECRAMSEARMTIYGHTLHQSDAGFVLVQASRPVLEWQVRTRVRALPNIEVVDECEASGLLVDDDSLCVTGVRVESRELGKRDIAADLVVLCLGRHGPEARWLADLGYARPAEEGLRIDMKYASRYLRLRKDVDLRDKEIVIANADPARGMALFAVEDGRHILTLIGYGTDHPPTDDENFWRFASSVAPRDVWEALVDAEPLTDIATYRYLANQRRRYERLTRFPRGLLVFGDAVCSFSPAFGQGMTMSALQAVALRSVLAGGDVDLAARYFRVASAAIDDAWLMTKVFDSAMPHVAKQGSGYGRYLQLPITMVLAAAEKDSSLGSSLARISGLLDPPLAALRPALIAGAGRSLLLLGMNRLAASATGRGRRVRGIEFDPLPVARANNVHRLRVQSVLAETADGVVVELDIPQQLSRRFRYDAGQHVVIHGAFAGRAVRRTYSLLDSPSAGRVRICVKRRDSGLFSQYALKNLKADDWLYVSVPAGNFTMPANSFDKRYCAVAAGSGIAPILSIIDATLDRDPNSAFELHYGSRDRSSILLRAEIAALSAKYRPRLRVVHYLSKGTIGHRIEHSLFCEYRRGRLTADRLTAVTSDRWFLCGPRGLVEDIHAALVDRGADTSRVHYEVFDSRELVTAPADESAPPGRVVLTGCGDTLEFDMAQGSTILDAALDHRADLPYSCLGGSCGSCLAVVCDGQADMDSKALLAISSEEIDSGHILPCQARLGSAHLTLRFVRRA